MEPKIPQPAEFTIATAPTAGYALTPGEQVIFQQLNMMALNAKCEVHDLNVKLEEAQAKVMKAEQAFSGALTFVANAHGMQNARLTPDFSRVVPA